MRNRSRYAPIGGLLVLLAALGLTPAQDVTDGDPAPENGIEIQLRGPIHEAFAQPVEVQPEPGQAVPKQPPQPIPEEPPDQRPDGDNVEWIPGYWAWDPERNDFLWVSGSYRNTPPGRQWVPGHWVRTQEGWRWVSGFWAPEQQDEVPLTPQPPAPLTVDPSLPPPGDDYSWVPGIWVYRSPQFVWRPGYWAPLRTGYLWVAPRYSWTPNGYAYCDGYWDYPLDNRGVLFAPAYFDRPYWNTPGWSYCPSHVVSLGFLFDSCFSRVGSFHLHFGDYYGSRYAGFGYRPWYNGHGRYDPGFAHHHWRHHGGDRDWHGRQRQLYADRGAGRLPPPPRTLAQQRALANNKAGVKIAGLSGVNVVAPLSKAKNVNKNVNLVKATPAQTAAHKSQVHRAQEIAKTRARPEGNGTPAPRLSGPRPGEFASIKLPPSIKAPQGPRAESPALKSRPIIRDSQGDDGGARTFRSKAADHNPPPRVNIEAKKAPNVALPRITESPRNTEARPALPKIATPSNLKAHGGQAPRVIQSPQVNHAPQVINQAPKMNHAPKVVNHAPKAPAAPSFRIETPRPAPAAHHMPAPRATPSVPHHAPAPRAAPSAPRVAPAPAPRHDPPPARSAPSRSGKGKR